MTTLNVSITTDPTFPIPAGVTPGKFLVRLNSLAGEPVAFLRSDTPSAMFSGVLPGDYVLTAQREDTNTNPFGPVVEQPVTVPDLTPRTEVPASIAATFAP
jgi:hypothetical protein